ncbi:hypothetical protein P7K49_005044 [Saguinus oedipus]|uniref:Uncharacterized protein n=1 Tax=Saguinus oedipus TaxID=9490 RepID=A0ABQ9W955_SAGOE|nr:hypothetical protein P7K49_005044 [Saguinus oedipus]
MSFASQRLPADAQTPITRGDRIRSKITHPLRRQTRHLVLSSCQGPFVAAASKKGKKPSPPAKTRKCQVGPQSGEVRKEALRDETKADTDTAPASFPAPGRCENCGISFSGDGTQRQRLKMSCKDCRAQSSDVTYGVNVAAAGEAVTPTKMAARAVPQSPGPSPPAEFIYYCVDEDKLQPCVNRRQNRKCGAAQPAYYGAWTVSAANSAATSPDSSLFAPQEHTEPHRRALAHRHLPSSSITV